MNLLTSRIMEHKKVTIKSRNRLSGSDRFMKTTFEKFIHFQQTPFKPGEKVGLQSLIDALDRAKDGVVTGVVVLRNKCKYNIEIPLFGDDLSEPVGKFRIANIEPQFIHEPFENGYHYNSLVARTSRGEDTESLYSSDLASMFERMKQGRSEREQAYLQDCIDNLSREDVPPSKNG